MRIKIIVNFLKGDSSSKEYVDFAQQSAAAPPFLPIDLFLAVII